MNLQNRHINISDLSDLADIIYIPLFKLAQIVVMQSAPINFSTPLCKNRYRKNVVFTERCLFYRLIYCLKLRINSFYRIICDLSKNLTAFLVRNRGPPSEV